MWIVLFALTEGHHEIFAIFGTILSSVLNDSLISFGQFFWKLGYVFLGIRLLQFDKYFRKECFLLIVGRCLLYFGFRWLLLLFDILFRLLRLHALKQLFAYLSYSMVIERTIWAVKFEEGKLWFMLFTLGENLLKI